MKLKARAGVQSNPAFRLTTRTSALPFRAGVAGAATAEVGRIDLIVDRIPLYATLPFRRGLYPVAALGGFGIRLRPFRVALNLKGLEISGVLGGDEGMGCEMCGTLECGAEVELDGRLTGQIARMALAFDEDEDLDGPGPLSAGPSCRALKE